MAKRLLIVETLLAAHGRFYRLRRDEKAAHGIDTAIVLVTGLDDVASILRAFISPSWPRWLLNSCRWIMLKTLPEVTAGS